MDNDKFVEIAKHLIVDYINKIIDRKCFIFGKITTNDVYVVWICKTLQNNKKVELHAIGASAVNQTCKAIASARGVLASKGYDIYARVGFSETEINGEKRTMIVFRLKVE